MISLAAFVIQICGMAINVTFSILNMMYGWGVQPKSWLWILLITPAMHVTAILFFTLGEWLRRHGIKQ
jgi:hypothetical protein